MPISPQLDVYFYRSDSGTEPVRDWLRTLTSNERKIIGQDLKTVQYGWPLGMPLVDHVEKDIWEIRSKLETPKQDLEIARARLKILKARR